MQKYGNLVELEKCCQTHIFLQNVVLIQPRTSPPKFAKSCKNLSILPIRSPADELLDLDDAAAVEIEHLEELRELGGGDQGGEVRLHRIRR